jgi:hypothetical protein
MGLNYVCTMHIYISYMQYMQRWACGIAPPLHLTPVLCQWACMTFNTKDGGGVLHPLPLPSPPRQQTRQVTLTQPH